ncbi:MAG TPA: hypothetical protein VGE39_10140, partial [Prosthecobacter sp.]
MRMQSRAGEANEIPWGGIEAKRLLKSNSFPTSAIILAAARDLPVPQTWRQPHPGPAVFSRISIVISALPATFFSGQRNGVGNEQS